MNTSLKKTAALTLALILAVIASTRVRAQETSNPGPTGAAPAATGPDTETQTIENPPLSGLDQPSFEPGYGARSYLVPKLQVSEAVDTNGSGQLNNNTSNNTVLKGVTRGLGSLTLQKMWKIHPLDIDYNGGVAWYQGTGKTYQLHSLGAVQRFLWRTGQLAVRDSFTYLPSGTFGFNSFGGSGGLSGGLGGPTGGLGNGLGGGGGAGTIGNPSFGSTVNQPRLSNSSIVDITQSTSPRNSVTIAGGYSFNDSLDNPTGYVNSQQVSGQLGFNRQLSRHDQIAITYAYQDFHFPKEGSGSFNTNVWQVLYGHRISGKLDIQFGGGPQWTHRYFWKPNLGIPSPPPTFVSNSSINGSGRATLTYFYSSRTNMNLSYSHAVNAGSGLFSGANSDVMRLALNHTLTRRWSVAMDSGYSYSKRILEVPTTQAKNASSYRYWYAGGTLRRQLTRHVGAFADYQYDSIGFSSGVCTTAPCSTGYGRHVGLIGLDWTPSPIRLE
jgi:hypothetical protein